MNNQSKYKTVPNERVYVNVRFYLKYRLGLQYS